MAPRSSSKFGLLLLLLVIGAEARQRRTKALKRSKREWVLPPTKLWENTDYTKKPFIAKIRSDKSEKAPVEYYLTGPGADAPPFNLFVVDHGNGYVRITDILDREKCQEYKLTGIALYPNRSLAEDNIPINVVVLDKNDNAPYVKPQKGTVKEETKKGTFVMSIKGEDADLAGTPNANLTYSIVSQDPPGSGHMFMINKYTGDLFVKSKLDRETQSFYNLVIKVTDMGGAPGGLSGTGTVEIKVMDINDNVPDLEKSEYSGSVDENVDNVVVMRIKALDKDEKFTDNWLTVFKIVKGNENNLFSIETDKKTNEGILMLIKPVDFETVQSMDLGIQIENVAPFVNGTALELGLDFGGGQPVATGAGAGGGASAGQGVGLDLDTKAGGDLNVDAGLNAGVGAGLGGGLGPGGGVKPGAGPAAGPGARPAAGPGAGPAAGPGTGYGGGAGSKPVKPAKSGSGPGQKPSNSKSYPIKISVKNIAEGPAFAPSTKEIPLSEDPSKMPKDGIVAVFPAVDPDTGKIAEDVSYAKAYDPDNWFSINEETAEIKLTKEPDRESPFVKNGTYIAKLLAISKDLPPKTATGTIAVQVADANDHCPTLRSTSSSLCSNKKTVFITAFDEDAFPNAAPFSFSIIPEGTKGSWDLEVINGTTAALHSLIDLWPGVHELQVGVKDAQGLSCPFAEVFTVDVCLCEGTEECISRMTHLKSTSFQMTAGAIALALMVPCLLLFIPLLMITCDFGAGEFSPDMFADLYDGNGEHLIAYNTEGQGEDKTLPQSPLHWQNTNGGLKAANVKSVSTAVRETHQMAGYMESMQQLHYTYPELFHREASHSYFGSSHSHNIDTMFESHMQRTAGLAEDMTITPEYFENYFMENCVPHLEDEYPVEVWGYEGQGSTTGSLSSCTCQDITDNLEFLTDLGTKFKTLAEICSPPSSTVRSSVKQTAMTALRSTSDVVKPVKSVIETMPVIETKQSNVTTEKATNVSSSSSSKVSTSHSSMTLPHSSVTNVDHSSHMGYSTLLHYPTQAVTLQQPFCYNTVVQPVQYMMAPNLQNTVLLEDWSGATNLSGMAMVNGSQGLSGPFVNGAPGSLTGLVTSNTGFLTSDTGLVTSNTGFLTSDTGLVTSNTGFLTSDTGLVTSNTGFLTSDTGLVTSNTGLVTSNTGFLTSDTGLVTSNTGFLTSDTGLVTSNTGLVTSNTGLVTSNTGFLTSNTGLITSNTEGCVNFQSSPSSVSPVGATVLLPGSPASGELVSPGSFSMDSWRIMPPNSGDSYMLLSNGSLEVEEEGDDLERLLMVSN